MKRLYQRTTRRLKRRNLGFVDEFKKLFEITNASLQESETENARLREKLRERKKHLREANRAAERLSLRRERPKALEAELFQQNHYLWKRVNELEAKLQSVTNDYQQTTP